MEPPNDQISSSVEELASAIRDQVPCDGLCLYLRDASGGIERVDCIRSMGPPAETLILPLVAGGGLVGRLHAVRSRTAFEPEERERLRMLSRVFATAAAAMAETARSRRRLDEAEMLMELGRITAAMADPVDVARRASELIGRILQAPIMYGIWVVDSTGRTLTHLASGRARGEIEKVAYHVDQLDGPQREAFVEGRIAFSSDGWLGGWGDPERMRRLDIRSVHVFPIRAGGESLGWLQIGDPRPNRPLSDADRRLIAGVCDQMAVSLRNARLSAENHRRLEELAALSRRLMSVQEEERRRIARELHDEAGQAMTALKLNLDLARREPDAAKMTARLADAGELAGEVLEELRRISHDLRPAALDDLGLLPALRSLVEGFAQRTGLAAVFEADAANSDVPAGEVSATAFRFVQEALTNVARHAQAGSVRVRVALKPDALSVEVEDDGVGFDVAEAAREGRMGLLGMRERARMLGGSVSLESRRGSGARLRLSVPRGTGSTGERGAGQVERGRE